MCVRDRKKQPLICWVVLIKGEREREKKKKMEELFLTIMEMASSSSLALAIIGLISWVIYVYGSLWYKSRRVRQKLRAQGIKGPQPSLLRGNLPDMQRIQAQVMVEPHNNQNSSNNNNDNVISDHHHQFLAHDYTSTLFPYFEHWRKQYGQLYTYSTGMKQHLYVNQPELVRELNQCITLNLGKPSHITNKLAPLLGNGILRANGLSWAHQRKLVAAEFFMDKVKGMVGLMIESAQPVLTKWEQLIEAQGGGSMAEVKVDADLRDFSADVISRVCFGHSYSKGKKLFSKLRSLQKAMSDHGGFLFGLSGFRGKLLFSTKNKQNQINTLEKEIESLIWELVEERKRECSYNSSEKDLMQLLLEAAMTEEQSVGGKEEFSNKSFIVDNCKNIYFAGHETTAVAASWSLMLLALHPQWQNRIRNEVSEICHNGIPDADSLPLLKTVTMVIHEVLRLYPPAAFVSREAYEDIQIGDLNVPKGVCLWTLIPTLHRDPEIWGQDSNEFKPERFKEGVSQACKFPQAYVPFGLGPRLCLGKNFAMVQLKVVLALIISKFSFSLSLSYRHSPAYRMIVEPGHGVYINIQKL